MSRTYWIILFIAVAWGLFITNLAFDHDSEIRKIEKRVSEIDNNGTRSLQQFFQNKKVVIKKDRLNDQTGD